jgi:hypothetical protein
VRLLVHKQASSSHRFGACTLLLTGVVTPVLCSVLLDSLLPFLQHDSDAYIGLDKTLDPQVTQWMAANQQQQAALQDQLPPYTGMQHPPPNNTGNARCDSMPWSAPFGPNYTVPNSSTGSNSSLQLTMCNWYLPQGPGVTAVHRCGRP